MPRYTICPYYIDENNKTISCEDVCRSYDSMDEKWAWMDMYCDSWDWMKCPYAIDRSEAYRRAEEGDEMAIEHQEVKAQKKEIESLLRKLGRANKKIERMQKKIDELRTVNQSFVNVNQSLTDKNSDLYKKWREMSDTMEAYERNVAGQVQILIDSYESRLAYMMDMFSDGTLNESDVQEWVKDKEWAIVSNDYGFEVRIKETKNEDTKIEE